MTLPLDRRTTLTLLAAAVVVACSKSPRCAHCGMKLDSSSPWATELTGATVEKYDTPRCALTAWRKGEHEATGVRPVEYYDRIARDGRELVFVVGSDVLGPMGPDVIGVAPERSERFIKDHGGRALKLDEVTLDVLQGLS